jgi:hypothetical protein
MDKKGIFLGQGFPIPEGTKVNFEKWDKNRVKIWNRDHTELLYILPDYFVEEKLEVKDGDNRKSIL